ncbi:MAG: c-type cytochrome [Sphingomicrobium sp.]
MCSRFRTSLAAAAAVAMLAGCDRDARDSRGKPLGETVPELGSSPDTIFPGSRQPPLDPRLAAYERNAFAIAQGQQLFTQMNCVGCHFHGGGGMGPALMDDEWRYGGRIDQIAATIAEGRPNGMPSWRAKLTTQQIWQLAAYVRSLSGQAPKDAVSARNDELSNTPPQTQVKREPLKPSDSAKQ